MSSRSGADVPGAAHQRPGGRRSHDPVGRRALHASSGIVGPVAAALGARAAPGFAVLVAVAAIAEGTRLCWPRARRALDRVAGAWFRPAEASAISGATMLACGYAVTWWLFPGPVAERAIVVAALADPMAATVGTRFGGGRPKSWAGSAACAATAALVLLLSGSAALVALGAAVVAAAVERAPWRGADNVAIPVCVGAVLRWAA